MSTMEMSNMAIVLCVVLVVVVLFLVGGCSLSCKSGFGTGKGIKEGYKRSCLAGDCYGLQRTPVDYAQKYPDGWQRNPHWKTYPGDEHQPLSFGPIDFWQDMRRLNNNDGVLFQQYGNNWKGCGRQLVSLTNDSKNRFDLENIGDHGARVILDDMYNPRFGPRGPNFTEQSLAEVNPYYQKIYGGSDWLYNDKLGD